MTPNNSIPPPSDAGPPKGDLEALFRHHLADAKAPPRPLVWEQLDNALLTRQNETYRRRLVATRWVAAASLLVASAAGADWWARHIPPATTEAVATQQANPVGGPGPFQTNRIRNSSQAVTTNNSPTAGDDSRLVATAGGQRTAPVLSANPSETTYSARVLGRQGTSFPATMPTEQSVGPAGQTRDVAFMHRHEALTRRMDLTASKLEAFAYGPGSTPPNAATRASFRSGGTPVARTFAFNAYSDANSLAAANSAWTLLALHPAVLATSARPLPTSLAAVATTPRAATPPLRRWQFGASYAAGVFHPNADFSRAAVPVATAAYTYYPAASASSLAVANRSASEYRAHLQGGLDQRLSLRATRLLGGRWALSTGVELGQHEAKSATSTSFVGDQLANYVLAPSTALRTTSFRYRTAGVPVALHYANPAKRGWSAYGRLGAVVSALLNVRSEVENEPKATKTYSLASAGSPYRRLLTTLRGGAGAQFRPAAGTWTLSAGPTAELGVMSLNSQPVQDFAHQRRPYSFGLEAAVDFGGAVKMP